jgi:hypothetical protein
MNIKNVDTILQSVNLSKESLDFRDNSIVGNLTGFKALLGKIAELPLFKGPKAMLLTSSLYATSADSTKMPDSEYNTIYLMHSSIVNGITALLDLSKQLQTPEDADSVTIKLPDPADFNEAVEFQSDFLIAISQNVSNPKIGGKVVLTSWEQGPFRLTLHLGSSLAVGLVGGIASAATVGIHKHSEGKLFENMVKGLDVKSEAIQEVLRGLQVYVNVLLDGEAKKLQAKVFGESSNPEQTTRLVHAIKLFMGLIEKGAEIHPSSKAPESVKSSFPDFSKIPGVEATTTVATTAKPVEVPQIPAPSSPAPTPTEAAIPSHAEGVFGGVESLQAA